MEREALKLLVQQLVRKQLTNSVATEKKDADVALRCGIFETVDEAIAQAMIAQEQFVKFSLAVRKQVVAAIRKVMLPKVEEMAEAVFQETGMGNVADKILKNKLAVEETPGVEDLVTQIQTGDNGMTLYELSPYGVIGAVTPSTNPTETLICKAIGMLAAGNAVFFSPHPGAKRISLWLIEQLNLIVKEACGIENLIVTVSEPSIKAAREMMKHPAISLLVITGGPGVVKQALESGKK